MRKLLLTFIILLSVGQAFAQQLLKQSTPTTVNIGPFIDDTDFKTLETGLTVTSMTVKLIKQSDTFSSSVTSFSPTASGGNNDCQHVASGMYNCELTAANTDTVGRLEMVITITGALPVFHRFTVVGVTAYDTQINSTASIDDLMETDCSTIASTTSPMGKICSNIDGKLTTYSIWKQTTTIATLSTQTNFTLTDGSLSDNAYNGWEIVIIDSTNPVEMAVGVVESYTGSTKTVTLRTDPAVFTMGVGDNIQLKPSRSLKSTVDNRSLDVTTTGESGVDFSNINGTLDAAEIGTAAITATQAPNLDAAVSTRASQTSVNTIDDFVDTEVAAIKTKTDFLPSATAGTAGGVFIAGTNAATTVTTAFTTTFTGNLTGSVASVTGAVGSVTGSVGGNVGGNVTGNVTGTIGGLTAAALKDFFDTDTTTTYASAVAGSVVKEITDNSGGAGFTVQNIVDGVWNEATSGHQTAGTTGKALTDASSAGDPWTSALSGYTTPGTAGYVLNTNLNATVTSRASQTSVDDVQTDTNDIQTRLPAALVSGRMDSSTGAMAANVITASAINGDAFTAAKFAADVSTEFAATLMATTFEGSNTFKHFLQYGAAALFGKYNSSSGTFNFRDLADTKNRIVYTTSSTARTSVTLSPD